MLNVFPLLHSKFPHHAGESVGTEETHQFIIERQVKTGGARVPLSTRAATQLIIDTARFMAFSTQHMEAADLLHLFSLRRIWWITAQDDVCSATRHIGGDSDGSFRACL